MPVRVPTHERSPRSGAVVGVDVGGTKIAGGLVDPGSGDVARELTWRTPVERGGGEVLQLCVAMASDLATRDVSAIGVGLCELVDLNGRPRSASTVDWRDLDVEGAFSAIGPVTLESDVRAAALAEARFGAGTRFREFVYLSVGTGISYSLMIDGSPRRGSRGNAIMVGAPPVELVAGGAGIQRIAGVERAEQIFDDGTHEGVVAEAAAALGLALAALVNALDPEAVVVGGGLGLHDAYRDLVVMAAREAIEAEDTRDLPIVPAELGSRSGLIGAALAAADGRIDS